MEIDHHGTKTCARSTKFFPTHPSFSKLTWSFQNCSGITTSYRTTGQTQIEIRLYIVPRKRLGRVNSGESVENRELPTAANTTFVEPIGYTSITCQSL